MIIYDPTNRLIVGIICCHQSWFNTMAPFACLKSGLIRLFFYSEQCFSLTDSSNISPNHPDSSRIQTSEQAQTCSPSAARRGVGRVHRSLVAACGGCCCWPWFRCCCCCIIASWWCPSIMFCMTDWNVSCSCRVSSQTYMIDLRSWI